MEPVRSKNETESLYKRAENFNSAKLNKKDKERTVKRMKAALISALMLGSQLIRAQDEVEPQPRRKYAACFVNQAYQVSDDDPEIIGFLLLSEGREEGENLKTMGVLADYNHLNENN